MVRCRMVQSGKGIAPSSQNAFENEVKSHLDLSTIALLTALFSIQVWLHKFRMQCYGPTFGHDWNCGARQRSKKARTESK